MKVYEMFEKTFFSNKDSLYKMLYDIINIAELKCSNTKKINFDSELLIDNNNIIINYNNEYYINIRFEIKEEKYSLLNNLIMTGKLYSKLEEKNITEEEMCEKKIFHINFKTFSNENNKMIERLYIKTDEGEIYNDSVSIVNIDINKCYNEVYNNINEINKISKIVRWGAILLENDLNKISQILGDDMLSMEEKKDFLQTIEDVNNDDEIIAAWIYEENARLKHEGEMDCVREEGIEEGIEQGIEQGIENNKIEVVKNMLNRNLSYDIISDVTGKSIDEIKLIEEELNN